MIQRTNAADAMLADPATVALARALLRAAQDRIAELEAERDALARVVRDRGAPSYVGGESGR